MAQMKVWALAWLLAAALSALLTQGFSAQGDELLSNGGFEAELGEEWAVTTWTSGDALERVSLPEPVHCGSYA
ncbi:MAG: hypothetical protein Q8P22_08960, partial [Chloroflexota bacterium]|nr:hypothetical protein [Chloroflexota bacterium]